MRVIVVTENRVHKFDDVNETCLMWGTVLHVSQFDRTHNFPLRNVMRWTEIPCPTS